MPELDSDNSKESISISLSLNFCTTHKYSYKYLCPRMLKFNLRSSGLLYKEAAGRLPFPRVVVLARQPSPGGVLLSQGSETGSQVVQAQAVACDAAEVAEGGQSVVEGELPGELPVAGVGGTQLPAGLAGEQPDLLAEAVAALHELHVCHDVRGDRSEPLCVQHRSSDANEEDDDLQGSNARREHLAYVVG